jgi:toxin ParE1/3/4
VKYRVEFNPEARADLLDLYDYIAEESGEGRALAYIARIEEACLSLETFPVRGKLLKGIRPGLRVLGFERRVSIAFQVNPGVVAIFRILYGGRDLNRALEQGSK